MKPNSSDDRWRARIEALLGAARTPPLSDERRNALRLRIMRELPRQAGRPLRASVARAGRTAGPALLACLLAAIAGAWLLGGVPGSGGGGPLVARATGDVQVNGGGSGDARPGDVIVARSGGEVAIGGDVHVGMGAGAALTFSESGQRVGLDVRAGSVTVRSDTREVAVSRGDWGASVQPSSEATFAVDAQSAVVSVSRGDVTVVSQGQTYGVTSSTSPQSFATTPSPAEPMPSPAPTVSPTVSATPSPTATSTATPTSTPTATPSVSPTPSRTPTASTSPSASATATATKTATTKIDKATTSPTAGGGAAHSFDEGFVPTSSPSAADSAAVGN